MPLFIPPQGNLHNYSRMQCIEQKKNTYKSCYCLWRLLYDPGSLLKPFSFPFFKCPPGGLQQCSAPAYQQRAKMPLMLLQTLALSSNNFLCQFVVVHFAPPWPENNVWRLFRPVNAAGTKIPQQQKLVPAVADQCISEISLWFSVFLFAFLFKRVSRTSSYCVTPRRWKILPYVCDTQSWVVQEHHRKAELDRPAAHKQNFCHIISRTS